MSAGKPAGRRWAYAGAILGGVASVAANVAHSYVPPPSVTDWSPHLGAVVGAVFWPVALFVAVEIFARVAWPATRQWTGLRFLGLLPVALVAAVVSYRHLSGLLAYYRDDALTTTIGPLAVDGLMVMATGALIATGNRRGTRTDAPPDVTPVPAVLEPVAVTDTATDVQADTSADTTPVTKPARRHVPRRTASADKVAKAAARMPGASVAAIAARAGVSESTARRYLPTSDANLASPTPIRPAATPALSDAA